MPVLQGRPKFPIIKTPKEDPRLKGFSCGNGQKWERDVNTMVKELHDKGSAHYDRLTVMAMESQSGDLHGICGFRPKQPQFQPPGPQMLEPPYIHVIGLSASHRGWTLEDEKTRLGSALLVGAIKKIAIQWPGDRMPAVWALVARKNALSHNLFERHGFVLIRKENGDHRQYRPTASRFFEPMPVCRFKLTHYPVDLIHMRLVAASRSCETESHPCETADGSYRGEGLPVA